ncbi:MAG: flagellar biosynthetic protein FliR [Selenomonadaceae bacterium]|nr:flagellar biosynthetic protein FliR [Selenomonadaceae bacterium]
MDFYDLLEGHAAVFMLLMTRVSGIFVISPFFGSLNIPVYFRAAAAFAFAIVLFPVIDNFSEIHAPASIWAYSFAVLSELFIGWLIGFVAYISFAAITMAGKVMDMQVGFAIVNVMDPTSGQQMPLIGSFLYNLTVIVFLVVNGHHMLIDALFESFKMVPLLSMEPSLSLSLIIANFTTGIFLTGMKVAMPVTFAILLTNVGLGILARTMPQMNIFVVGIPMQLTVGVLILSMVLPFYVLFLDVLFNEMYGNITIALQALQ